MSKYFLFLLLYIFTGLISYTQQALSLKDAVAVAVENYGTLKAKEKYAESSRAMIEMAKREYVPNLNISAQQVYGTVNGQNGPLYGFGLSVASSGLPLNEQSWNSAFGALYLTNINWDFFSFGKTGGKIRTARAIADQDQKDFEQAVFQHKVQVAAAYLNLLAAQQLTRSYRKNLERADTIRRMVSAKAAGGLIPGVDSSLANAEYSNARIILTQAIDMEQEKSNQLAVLLGISPGNFVLDTFFVSRVPVILQNPTDTNSHPLLQWYESRISVSTARTRHYRAFYYPTFTLVGVLQTRASGFGSNYAFDQTDFTRDYGTGVVPTRTNYLAGIGVTWNLTQPLRMSQQVKSQKLISQGLEAEYTLAKQQITAQLQLAETKIRNALENYREAPVQVKAAQDAYTQKSVLYRNGLTDLVNVTQSLYALIRAETDRDIAYNNVWQALLLKAAASGDFSLFENQF